MPLPLRQVVATVPEAFTRVMAGVPPTDSAPVNIASGIGLVASSAAGAAWAAEDHLVIGLSAFLNGAAQIIKMPSWLDQNRWLLPILFLLGIAVAWWLFDGDHRRAFNNGCIAALKALADYRADKVSGLGILPPAATPGG